MIYCRHCDHAVLHQAKGKTYPVGCKNKYITIENEADFIYFKSGELPKPNWCPLEKESE